MKKGPSLLKIVLIRTELSKVLKTTVDCKSVDERIEDLIIEKQTTNRYKKRNPKNILSNGCINDKIFTMI